MDSKPLLQQLREQLHSGEISASEVLEILAADDTRPASRLAGLLYYIGAGIVFLGMAFLIAQEWHGFSPPMKVFVTLGSGLAAFAVGVLFSSRSHTQGVASAFFLIASLLLPGGMLVLTDEYGILASRPYLLQVQISGILAAGWLASWWLLRKNILLVFTLIFTSWLYLATMNYLLPSVPIDLSWRFQVFVCMLPGFSYLLLGYAFSNSPQATLSSWLYAAGSFLVLLGGLLLGGWKPNQSYFWETVYPGMVFLLLYLSTILRSRSILVFSALALGAYLMKITAEYFSDSLGWAFSLVLIGFLLMGVAWGAVRINKRYMRNP